MEEPLLNYLPQRRLRSDTIALLLMTMTLSAPTTGPASTVAIGNLKHPNGLFDANGSANVASAMQLYLIEQRKRNLKRRIFNLPDIQLPDELQLLPYQTADYLARLDIEPDYVLPTEDNGMSIEFRYNSIYHLIEFLSSGEIVLLKKVGNQIEAWDLTTDNFLDTLYAQLA